jgi:RNA polymerase sigma factor (sigma-70 family)
MLAESSDTRLLMYFRAGDKQSVEQLYRHCYPPIEHFVVQNNGSQDQAKDLFQETLLILLTNVQEPTFQLTSSLKTYVFAISKNLWLSQLKRSARWTGLENADEPSNVMAPIELATPPTAYELVMTILAKLTVHCQALLSAIFFRKKPMTDIVQEDGYASLHSAQNQKYKCLQQARKVGERWVRSD